MVERGAEAQLAIGGFVEHGDIAVGHRVIFILVARLRRQIGEKIGAQAQPDFDGAHRCAFVFDHRHAARADSGASAFKPGERLAGGVGVDHGLAEGRQIVAAFFQFVDADQGGGRGRVELELNQPGFGQQLGKTGRQKAFERHIVAVGHRALHRRQRGDQLGACQRLLVRSLHRRGEPILGNLELAIVDHFERGPLCLIHADAHEDRDQQRDAEGQEYDFRADGHG